MLAPRRWPLLLLPPALLAAGWLALGQGTTGGPAGPRAADEEVAEAEEEDAELARIQSAAPGEAAEPALEDVAAEGDRSPAVEPAPAAETPVEVAAPRPLVMGVVVDGGGTPLPGVIVKLSVTTADATDSTDSTNERGSFMAFPKIVYIGETKTDASGGFTFQGSDRSKGGHLTFGEGYLLGGSMTQQVLRDAPSQVLEIPFGPGHDSTWTIEVVDSNKKPVPIEEARLTFLGGVRTALPHLPDSSQQVRQLGIVEQRGLPPGRWRMTVSTLSSLAEDVEIEILEPRSEVASLLVLQTIEGGLAEQVEPTLDSDGKPWIDPASGLRELLPDELLAIGENNRDHHFAQSFRVGSGSVRAAQLVLDIEGNSGMSSNDSIYLQHLGGKKYAWANRLTAFTGGRWSAGMRRRILVDLSRLPLATGGTYDLRPQLASGRLDVVIQDDTVVHEARLRLVRGN